MLVGNGDFRLIDIVELAVVAFDVGVCVANEPDAVETAFLQHFHDVAVLFVAALAEFAHLADNRHFRTHIHLMEILKREFHRGRIGIIGIDDEAVLGGFGELRTIVRGNLTLDGMADFLGLDGELQADGDGCQHIVDIIGADEMGLDVVPLRFFAAFFKVEAVFLPTEV